MSKKNRVVASVTVHLTEDGTYKICTACGDVRRHAHGLTQSQALLSVREMQAPIATGGNANQAAGYDRVALAKLGITASISLSAAELMKNYEQRNAAYVQGLERLLGDLLMRKN